MKLSALMTTAVLAEKSRKVPPRHPLDRLNTLVTFSAEVMDMPEYNLMRTNRRENWKKKFAKNAERMEKNFTRGNQRCGFYDESQMPHGGPETLDRKKRSDDFLERYDRDNACIATKQITTGFRKWAERYIAQCSGQKKKQFQIKRMNKWFEILQDHLESANPDACQKEIECTMAAVTGTSSDSTFISIDDVYEEDVDGQEGVSSIGISYDVIESMEEQYGDQLAENPDAYVWLGLKGGECQMSSYVSDYYGEITTYFRWECQKYQGNSENVGQSHDDNAINTYLVKSCA